MSYTKREWTTGNVVGAVDLNRIEDRIANIDVDEIRGWGVGSTQLFSESVTTEVDPEQPDFPPIASLLYTQFINLEQIIVSFGGTNYVCNSISDDPSVSVEYGAPWSVELQSYDFSEYPFSLYSEEGKNYFTTETAGTYTIAVSTIAIEVSDAFSDAVNMAVVIPDVSTMPFRCVDGQTSDVDMQTAFADGRILYFFASATCFYITEAAINSIKFFPESQHVSATFVNNIFTVTIT